MKSSGINVAPSASRLTGSLRDIGYSFESAVADLIDNSIAAGATAVDVFISYAGRDSRIFIVDNGKGMNEEGLAEALRFGTKRGYKLGELGRYGLGLKTASLSQCRRLVVYSREERAESLCGFTLDLDFIEEVDDWMINFPDNKDLHRRVEELLTGNAGTVVVWEKLDRLLPAKNPDSSWARQKFLKMSERLQQHLEMVFHRFLSAEVNASKVQIRINGEELLPWDPFARTEEKTDLVNIDLLDLPTSTGSLGRVVVHSYCLPSRSQFSSHEAFERAGGPRKWNRQQGLYIYRANRLVQWGGWDGIRTIDEHVKLARVALDFDTDLDDEFNINVAKMRVTMPHQLKKMLARSVADVCAQAGARYRRDQNRGSGEQLELGDRAADSISISNGAEVGLALKSAAAQSGHYDAFLEMSKIIRKNSPDLAKQLGL
ncbi:ATP-binding protein [Corynebacterium variabile]|uniref:ATP-binding protein n=1 Tax=Corynebacterium variabile TaxID=1727 RepID=UPI00093973B7|nr:ATP-binding protein [Corynebacterium variabile]